MAPALLLQYRTSKEKCTWRLFGAAGNGTTFTGAAWPYAVEQYFHEALLQSPHRTLDPEEAGGAAGRRLRRRLRAADLFYVPVYASCLMEAVLGYADAPCPSKVQHGAVMYQEALDWLRTAYPFWNRTQGRDHVWLFTHDEGACWAPTEVYRNSIVLTHYGVAQRAATDGGAAAAQLPLPPPSSTTRREFNYSVDVLGDERLPGGWRRLIEGHGCYDASKDLVIPAFRPPAQYHAAMALGGMHRKRDILLLLRGDMGDSRPKAFSGGLRQEVHSLARDKQWASKYSIRVGNTREIEGDYSLLLARSTYCLVLPEDGWVALFEDAVLHGCIPVYVSGGPRDLHAPFASILK
ncbi:exostosin-like glycosyltransferase, partial [Monoraphidium neglectum]